MSRLFITQRELDLIADIAKEYTKDVLGNKIYLYPISELKTLTHDIYNEATLKVYDNPIAIDAVVDAEYQQDTKIDKFGVDSQYKIEVFIQYRDLVDKGITISLGDFFSFSDIFYEVTTHNILKNIYGLPEHKGGVKLVGTKARFGQFDAPVVGPTDYKHTDPDAVQNKFVQQRGEAFDAEGKPTGDFRELIKNGALDPAMSGPKEVSEKGDKEDVGSSFYDE